MYTKKHLLVILAFTVVSYLSACQSKNESNDGHEHPHSHNHAKETFSIDGLVEEVKTVPDSIIEYLHRQHHSHKVLERRTVPVGYETREMKYWKDYAAKLDDLPVINPGPGEYVM